MTTQKPFLQKFFPEVLRRTEEAAAAGKTSGYCKYDNQLLQLFTSSLYIAGLIATYAASYTTNKWGRRITMQIAGLSYLLGTAITSAAAEIVMLIVGRIFLGIGVGFANQVSPEVGASAELTCKQVLLSVHLALHSWSPPNSQCLSVDRPTCVICPQAVPLYLSEMAPPRLRGALNILFQLFITIGIFIANLVNYGTGKIDKWGWRLSFAGAGAPAFILGVGGLLLPDTPNSLIQRGKMDEGRAVLVRVRGTQDVEEEVLELVEASDAAKQVSE